MQRATATAIAAAAPTTRSPARRPLLPLPPLSVASAAAAESAFAKVCARPPARSPLLREIESRRRRRLTAPRAANRPAWPRRTAAEGEEARQRRRPPNENQAKRRRRARRARSGPVGSNRGLFCQCSLVHEAGKSWCQETETEERKSSSSGRGSGRGLRCGSDTANDTFPSLTAISSSFRQSVEVNFYLREQVYKSPG